MRILFVHGLGGNNNEHRKLREMLSQHTIACYEYLHKWGTVSLREIAQDVAKKYKAKPTFDAVIGLSQGGIICSLAHEEYGLKTRSIITICTPFQGSYTAYLLPFIGTKELRPKSKLLVELLSKIQKSKTVYTAIYNPLDIMVFPGKNAINPYAKNNICVYAIVHLVTFWKRQTLRAIAAEVLR